MNDFFIVAIPIILLVSLVALFFYLFKQRKKNEVEEAKVIDDLREQVQNEKDKGESNSDFLSSQIVLLLTEIKNSNEHIEKHMAFFKTLAIISIMVAAFIGFITVVSMSK